MPSVFDYLDFRRFLRDYYAEKKARSPAFSYENFARRAGLKSKGMLHDILSGKRRLTQECLFKVAEACGLEGSALAWFEALAAYGQAASAKERDWILARLKGLRAEARVPAEREIAGLCVAFDEAALWTLEEEIRALRRKVLRLSASVAAPTRMVRVDFRILPATAGASSPASCN